MSMVTTRDGAQIYYADGLEALASNFVEVRPTIVACVPRLYEVMLEEFDAVEAEFATPRMAEITAAFDGLDGENVDHVEDIGCDAFCDLQHSPQRFRRED